MSSRPLDPEERAELEALMALGDDTIDTVDIPEFSEEKWAKARRGAFSGPSDPNSVSLDHDVVSWFRSHSSESEYRAEINRVLRQHVIDAERRRA